MSMLEEIKEAQAQQALEDQAAKSREADANAWLSSISDELNGLEYTMFRGVARSRMNAVVIRGMLHLVQYGLTSPVLSAGPVPSIDGTVAFLHADGQKREVPSARLREHIVQFMARNIVL